MGTLEKRYQVFSSSLERFYEFCIELFVVHNGIDLEEFEKAWDMVSNQSERQLGAFYFLYLTTFEKSPTDVNKIKVGKKIVELRNDVTHKGYIPSKKETMDFGKVLFNFMSSVINELYGINEFMHVAPLQRRIINFRKKGIEADSTMGYSPILPTNKNNKSFDEALEEFSIMIGNFYKKETDW